MDSHDEGAVAIDSNAFQNLHYRDSSGGVKPYEETREERDGEERDGEKRRGENLSEEI